MVFRTRKKDKRVFFIARAIGKKGALTEYVRNTLGPGGFTTHDGRMVIKPSVIRTIASGRCLTHGKVHVCPNETTQRRARLAVVLQKIRERRR